MLRTSMRNFVRMTVPIVVVLIGREIGSAAASEPLSNLQEPAHLRGIELLAAGAREVTGEYFFTLDVNYT